MFTLFAILFIVIVVVNISLYNIEITPKMGDINHLLKRSA